MDNFRIEDAKVEDVEAMRAIVKYWWLELYPNEKYGITKEDLLAIDFFSPEYLARKRKEVETEVTVDGDETHDFVLKNEKDEVVGFCGVSKHGNYQELEAIYLTKELQGRGFAEQLMQKGLEWLRKDQDIIVKVVAYNSRAIGFYKKMGFKETVNKVIHTGTQLPSGKEIPRIEMLRQKSS
jgi:GNAT superfamily N-acetyltransferase